jgi:RimJ/RimL family protein N-acetyltransferase
LVLRCWNPVDAPLLKVALDTSLEHLRPWLPWARHEPQPVEEKAQLLRRFRANFDRGRDFAYGIFTRDESKVLGGTGLHKRVGPGAFEIGYWIHVRHVGQGFATESTAALTRVAFEVCGVDRIEIHVEPGNPASAAIPRKLGFAEEARLRRRLAPHGDGAPPRDIVVFVLFADEFAASPMSRAAVAAFDALGEQVL